MLKWEMANPEKCTASDQDASHLFGYQSVGQRKLADRFKFVFVPGLQDAADEAVERKGSILERLLAAIADQRAEAREGLSALEDRFREEYTNLVESTHRPTLDGLADSLGEQMRRYVPSAEIRLEPVAQQLAIAPPRVLLRGGEELISPILAAKATASRGHSSSLHSSIWLRHRTSQTETAPRCF